MKLVSKSFLPSILFLVFAETIILFCSTSHAQSYIPYSTDSTHLTIWNGTEYIPFFVKGINLGVSVPGTLPGELAASREDYVRWIQQIKEAGFNSVRLYTLHYPRFYEVLDSINRANPHNPLLFFQGVWLNEKFKDYNNDLYFLMDTFKIEIAENIDCVHGNRFMPDRFGKAYGDYNTDASKWCLGYIIGREILPKEVLVTDAANPGIDHFSGNHFIIKEATATECWFTAMLDFSVHYENENYNTQRPVSVSNWPTLDPLEHQEERSAQEDTANLNLARIKTVDAPAGIFISYHVYPYYPDFISLQSTYQDYQDDFGPNSYLGYLEELKSHYCQYPLIISEFGVPSSWVIAHYATSGMNHGGFDEQEQGNTNIRLLSSIEKAGCGGGMQFEWIDEWFKSTWITNPIDYGLTNRTQWHNLAAAEQNYGLVTYTKEFYSDTLAAFDSLSEINHLNAKVNSSFFELEIGLKKPLDILDEVWVAFDTYGDTLGELLLPGNDTIPSRSEFALQITNYSAKLHVTEAYDIFAIWHHTSDSSQLYKSTPSDGSPWRVVRIKNNDLHSDVQYIGNLDVNYSFQKPTSKDAVIIHDDKINVRIPWSYLNVVAPNKLRVLHDDRYTSEREDTVSEGFIVSVRYKENWYSHNERYKWDEWGSIKDSTVTERLKTSYYVMKDRLPDFNSPAIAVSDSFNFQDAIFPVDVEAERGILKNDFDMDGEEISCLITENPKRGQVFLSDDGSFTYSPNPGFVGYDEFKYSIFDGHTLSKPNSVVLYVDKNISMGDEIVTDADLVKIYPNPTNSYLNIQSNSRLSLVRVFNMAGNLIDNYSVEGNSFVLDVSDYKQGNYLVVTKVGERVVSTRFVKK